jgi:hypothetical protein
MVRIALSSEELARSLELVAQNSHFLIVISNFFYITLTIFIGIQGAVMGIPYNNDDAMDKRPV